MVKYLLFPLMLLFINPLTVISQHVTVTQLRDPVVTQLPATILDGDTVSIINVSPVFVCASRVFPNVEAAFKYYKFQIDVKTAYPYAVMAGVTFRQFEATLQTMTCESDKRKYLRKMDKELKEQYRAALVNMSPEQGKILFKLINRETGTTSFAMVKELRGSFSAFMWQSVARLYGNNLKDTYDPKNEDKDIEEVVQLIQTGVI